jgi:hypothetical protein
MGNSSCSTGYCLLYDGLLLLCKNTKLQPGGINAYRLNV